MHKLRIFSRRKSFKLLFICTTVFVLEGCTIKTLSYYKKATNTIYDFPEYRSIEVVRLFTENCGSLSIDGKDMKERKISLVGLYPDSCKLIELSVIYKDQDDSYEKISFKVEKTKDSLVYGLLNGR